MIHTEYDEQHNIQNINRLPTKTISDITIQPIGYSADSDLYMKNVLIQITILGKLSARSKKLSSKILTKIQIDGHVLTSKIPFAESISHINHMLKLCEIKYANLLILDFEFTDLYFYHICGFTAIIDKDLDDTYYYIDEYPSTKIVVLSSKRIRIENTDEKELQQIYKKMYDTKQLTLYFNHTFIKLRVLSFGTYI